MFEAHQICVNRGADRILTDVDLHVSTGDVVGIVGPNGAGKSTLVQTLYKELTVTSGNIVIDSDDLDRLTRRQIAARVAVVAQESDASMPLTVRDAVGLGRLPSCSLLGYGDDSDKALVADALERVELSDLADRLTTQLSGGERQRVLIARAIAQQASHLLLDEPTNHLDLGHQFALLKLVRELATTTVIVLHDLNLAAQCCDTIVLLNNGQVLATGTPSEVLVPDLISTIYGISVDRITHHGQIRLLFDEMSPSQQP